MKRDQRLIDGMRRVCTDATDDDLHEFLAVVYRSAFLGGFDYARRFPQQTHQDAESDLDELALRSSSSTQ